MSVNNTVEAFKFCEQILNKILDFKIATHSGETVFTAKTIEDVRQIAAASIYGRKKKDYGVIGGSTAGVAGGVMSLVGAALIPFTFGTSMLLLVSGGVIGLAGAGTSIGFSVEKHIDDKNSREQLEPTLKKFIGFNELFAKSTVTIQALLNFIRTKKPENETSIPLIDDQLRRIDNIEIEATKLYEDGSNDINIYKKIELVDACVGNVQNEMGELLKYMLTVDEISDFVNKTKQQCKPAFDHLAESIPEPPDGGNNEVTFRVLVRRYLDIDAINPGKMGSDIPIGKAGEAVAKTVAHGGAVAARTAVRAVDATDNIAKVGGTIARVAKGVSVASVMLSAVGMIIDIAFLGHAIYDLVQVSEMENRRGANTNNSAKIDTNDFADLLLELADIMEFINEICL